MTKQVSKFDKKSQRLRERMRFAMPAQVRGRESQGLEWMEMTRLVDVTPFGARFQLSRPTEPGRLLHLTLAMPARLRAFDHAAEQYRVWSIVRNVRLLDQKEEKDGLIEVGAAFIGPQPPKSYEDNPTQRYEIAQTKLESGLWQAADAAEQLAKKTTDEKRKVSRQLIPVDVVIQVFDEGKPGSSENTVTENISARGAVVFSTLDVAQDTFVKMSSERYNAEVMACVRGARKGADGITRLHLEFVGSEWPL